MDILSVTYANSDSTTSQLEYRENTNNHSYANRTTFQAVTTVIATYSSTYLFKSIAGYDLDHDGNM